MNHNFTFRPNTWDENIFRIVNEHNEYKLPDSFKGNETIVDIGAHIGSFSYACLSRGANSVSAFEASPENYELTVNNLSQFGERAQIRNRAVWRSDTDFDAVLKFAKSEHSVNTGGGNVWSGQGDIEVQTISLDEILKDLGRVQILKLDCEASEYPILLTSTRLGQVDSICGEYHEIGGQYNPDATIPDNMAIEGYSEFTVEVLRNFLNDQGFRVQTTRSKMPNGEMSNLGLFFADRIL